MAKPSFDYMKMNDRLQQAEQQRDAAHAALTKFGKHWLSCGSRYVSDGDTTGPVCTCGLDAALAASAPADRQ